jgi:HPt (histidine-containing phosphotransfer) domain-containing protein
MDMQMPDLDGLRATMAIRARERGAWRTPILGLTGNAAHPGYRERCMAAGMDDVFGKPIDLAELTSAVERWTSKPDARGVDLPIETPAPAPRLTVVSGHFEPPSTVSVDPLSVMRAVELPQLPDGPALDVEQLNMSSMALPALRTSLLHAYLGDVYPRLERLQESLDSGDPRRIEFEAHGLRGMCATIGAAGCVTLFGEMELWAREERVADCRRLLEPALHEVQRTEEFIHRLERMVMREAA